jgi:preprotein translocase subunit SecE
MKAFNKISQILAIVFGLGSLVLFFFGFAEVVSNAETLKIVGAQFAFGGKVGKTDLAISADLLFCFILTALSLVMSVFSFKAKALRYTAPVTALVSAVYMLVIALSNPWKFVDVRPLANVTGITYTPFVLVTAIVLFVFAAFATAYLFIDDYIEVLESKGTKTTILRRVIQFFRDYKSEIKKIVWPGFKDVAKNTLIVIIMCLIVGALIWLEDFGLGKLIALILSK